MAINFTDSPSNGATQTISGRTYTYNSAKNKWDTTATEVTGPTATVYAAVDNLPLSGNITGSQAFVSSTNRLYIWNGSGWYNIALVNSAPTISGVSSSYDLATDGTATTVTITATDPEGLPITYSIVSDTSGNIATVAQGTGSNTNVFTITPSTNTSHAGTFSLTFRASDGVNLATAVSSFTLQFSVANQRYTTALITSVGANNAVNTSFDDKSASNHTLPVSGDVHQTTFSPYRHGGYSVKFDGSSDNLGFASLSALNVNTYMSLECWVKLDDKNNANELIVGRDSGYWLMYDWPTLGVAQDKFGLGMYSGGSWQGVSSTTSPESGIWYHIVGVREDSTLKIYVNGTLENTATISGSPANGGVVGIGANTNQFGGSIKGHLADVRVVISANSSSLPYTSNFTPPEDRLTAITDTQLLACHLPYMQEGSTHGHTITMNGNVKVVPVGPHDKTEYAAADHGGSMSLDGNGDRIRTAASADFGFGTGDFTVEWWTYFNPGSIGSASYPYQIDMRSADNDTPFGLYLRTNLQNQIGVYVSASTIATGTYGFKEGTWQHYAICKTGGYLKGYYNGKQDFSITCTRDYGSSETISIGAVYGNNNYWVNGNMADVRVVKGTAVYTSDFTPPTAPLTAITNTKLLVQGTDAGIIDKAQVSKQVKLVGNTKSSTDQYKFLTSSMYFDGTGDYVQLDNIQLPADFTIELWARLNVVTTSSNIPFVVLGNSSATGNWQFDINASNNLRLQYNVTGDLSASTGLTANTWHHLAVVRSGTTVKIYKDGTEVASGTISQNFNATETVYIARNRGNSTFLNGYVSDVRITAGLARYTANFTPPTAALQG